MTAGLTQGALNTKAVNAYEITVSYEITVRGSFAHRESFEIAAPGSHKRWQAFEVAGPGLYNVTIQPFLILANGSRQQLNALEIMAPGYANIAIIPIVLTVPGVAKQFVSYTMDAPGAAARLNSLELAINGEFKMLKDFELTVPGQGQWGLGHEITVIGIGNYNQPKHTRVYRQMYHVEDDSLARWELYVGVDAMPDFDDVGQPVATSQVSPVTWTPPLPGAGETSVLYVVPRRRNNLGLLDHQQHPRLIEINEFGNEELGPLTPPELAQVLDGHLAGTVQAWARYPYQGDRNPANYWELYAKEGADPVPGVDPVLATAPTGSARRPWHGVAAGLTPGATYHVMVAIRRGADGLRAQSTVMEITLIPTYDIAAEDASMFAGEEYEINQ